MFSKVEKEMSEMHSEFKMMEQENNQRSKEIRESIRKKSKAMKERRKDFGFIRR